MAGKRWFIATGAFLLVALVMTGYLAIAADYGSQEDPLVTLSYISDVLSPDMLKKVEDSVKSQIDAFQNDMDARLKSYSAQVETQITDFESKYKADSIDDALVERIADAVLAKMSGQTGQTAVSGTVSVDAPQWSVVKVDSGKSIMLPLGAEIVLRIGSGTCVSSGSTGLINLSDATVLGPGSALAANNLYLVTIEPGRGVKATSAMTVLVRGEYTIQ